MDTLQQDNDFEYDEADENKIQVIIEKAQPQQTQVKSNKDWEYYVLLKFLRNPIKVCLVILQYLLIVSFLVYVTNYENQYNSDTPDYSVYTYPSNCNNFTPEYDKSYCANVYLTSCISYESVIVNGSETWKPEDKQFDEPSAKKLETFPTYFKENGYSQFFDNTY